MAPIGPDRDRSVPIESIGAALYSRGGDEALSYELIAGIEESLELIGLLLLVRALLEHARTMRGDACVRVVSGASGYGRRAAPGLGPV